MSNLNHFTIKIRDRDNGKEITSDLSHILLTSNNPRYKIISDKNINLIQFLKACDKTQEEIIKDLLDREGDFSDFKRLIESINENGFIDLSDEVLVIQKDNSDYYLVVERNRCIVCLKLLLGLIKIPKYYKLMILMQMNDHVWKTKANEMIIKKMKKTRRDIRIIVTL